MVTRPVPDAHRGRTPGGWAIALYGIVVYLWFLAVFAYLVGCVSGLLVPRTIDEGPSAPGATALVIDLGLLTAFAAHHSVMARPAFKRAWARFVPPPIERSTYVLVATTLLAGLMWQWRPLPATVWDVELPAGGAIHATSFLGWGLALAATFMIDHFDLFGLRQVLRRRAGRPPVQPAFVTPALYRLVRHPLYLGFLIAFWAAPTLSQGRLLFASVMTTYILVAVRLEERDLVATFGDQYRSYQEDTPMLLPGRVTRTGPARSRPG
jgi:methanethiol S-methyltransferase